MESNAALQLAERFFAAIGAGDIETVGQIYASDAVIWHNHTRTEQTREANLKVLAWVVKHVRDLRYDEIRRHPTPTGFVQQHVLRGIGPTGTDLEIPACIVCVVDAGRITRLDEYIDSAQAAALMAR